MSARTPSTPGYSPDIVLLLREARSRAGLTQEQAAKLSGIGAKSISTFETGTRNSQIKVEQLAALVRAYGLTLEQLFSPNFLDGGTLSAPPSIPRSAAMELVSHAAHLSRRELDACAQLLHLLVVIINGSR